MVVAVVAVVVVVAVIVVVVVVVIVFLLLHGDRKNKRKCGTNTARETHTSLSFAHKSSK